MAILFMDGFTHYATADITLKWTSVSSAVIGSGTGRFGAGSMRFSGVGSATVSKSLTWGDATSVLGFGFKTNSIGVGAIFVQWGNMELVINASGTLALRRSGSALATSSNTISSNVWYHFGIKVFHNASTGTVQLQVNGVDWIPSTGSLNTGATPGGVTLTNNVGNPYTTDYDGLYVLDGTGGAPWNDLLGDCKVETLRPTSEGNTTDWTPSTGTDNALTVDEATPNGDTDYNSTTTITAKDTLVHGDLSTVGGTVFGVQTIMSARKLDAQSRQLAPVIRQGGTDYDGTGVGVSTSYSQLRQIYPQDPTGANWSIANVNADEFGYKLVV